MTKEFKTLEGFEKHIKTLFNDTLTDATIEVSEQFLEDSKKGYVPVLTGALLGDSMNDSDLEKGLIIYDKPYSRRRYFNNISGIEEWGTALMNKNETEYKKIITKVYEQNK